MAPIRLRRLFTELESEKTQQSRRRYVRDELVRMIREGDFYLTEVMNQRPTVKQYAGDVIFGHGIDDGTMGHDSGTHITSFPIPQEIKTHQIAIESKNGKPIQYIDGVREVEGVTVGAGTRHEVAQMEDNLVDLGVAKAKVGLREAWLILKNNGELVAFAPTKAAQNDTWIYREVRDAKQVKKMQEQVEARA